MSGIVQDPLLQLAPHDQGLNSGKSGVGGTQTTSLSLQTKLFMRRLLYVLAGLTSLFLAMSYFDFNQALKFSSVFQWQTHLLWIAIVLLAHLAYLRLVFHIFILSQPIDKFMPKEDLKFPLILILSYVLFAFSIIYNSIPLNIVSLASFVSLYFFWFKKDRSEYRQLSNTRVRLKLGIWVVIDFSFFLVLGGMLIYELVSSATWWWAHGSFPTNVGSYDFAKDISIIVCVAFFYVSRESVRFLVAKGEYKGVYLEFLSLIKRTVWEWRNANAKQCLEEFAAQSGTITIVDFGCADGNRLKDFLSTKYSGLKGKFEVLGVDNNDDWKFPFAKTLTGLPMVAGEPKFMPAPKFFNSKSITGLAIVHFSHILYEVREQRDARRVLQKVPKGSLVVVRGYAAKSVFCAVASQKKSALWQPNFDLIWVSAHLADLCHHEKLERVSFPGYAPSSTAESIGEADVIRWEPDAYIKQVVDLKPAGSVSALMNLLEFLYGSDIRASTEEYLESMKEQGTQTLLSDDVVFVLRKTQ